MSQRHLNFRQSQGHAGFRRTYGKNRRGRQLESFAMQIVTGCLFIGAASWTLAPQLMSHWRTVSKSTADILAIEHSAYYRNCDEARAAGVAPIYRGSPGFREGMDGDSDGIACEPYRGS